MTTDSKNKGMTNFVVKKPDKTRRTFQIIPYKRVDGRLVYGNSLKHEALEAINQRLLENKLTESEANLHIRKVLFPKLKNQFGIPEKLEIETQVNADNLRIFREFWNSTYRRKKLEDPQTAKNEFLAALRFIEPLSILSNTIESLQDHWDAKVSGNRHRKYGGRINQLLRSVNRDEHLILDKTTKPDLKCVSWDELQEILEHVSDPVLRDLYIALWGTGCRLGEMFALESKDLKDNGSIFICKQLTRQLVFKRYTKNRVNHHTVALEEALPALRRWLAVANKRVYRKRCIHPFRNASRVAFKDDPQKHISPHKLRHSYVRYLIERGISLDKVKDLIGDTLKTTEECYGGWITTNSEVESIVQTIREANDVRKRKKLSLIKP